jgi:hypothetical protein
MLAQIVLTPTESKKLIAKAIARMDIVQRAACEGLILFHPSSSTYFIIEELTGKKPPTNYWVCGVVTPKGLCVEMGMTDYPPHQGLTDPRKFSAWWTVRNNKLVLDKSLEELLDEMKETDIFIKGVNALDIQGDTGILIGDPVQGGTLGVVMNAWRKKNFNLIYPAGLEKLIPIPVSQAVKEAKPLKCGYSMGFEVGLFPCPKGITVTEIDAIRILSGATAVPIAAGGLGGAEGAITLVIKGEEEQVKTAIGFVEQSKGAKLPQLRLNNCNQCTVPDCHFSVSDKPWVL